MLRWTTNSKRLQQILLTYWVLFPILFYVYLLISSIMKDVAIQDLIQYVPGIALGNLIACLTLFQAAVLFFVSRVSQSREGLLGQFVFISIFQQAMTGNIIGALLTFFLRRALLPVKENTSSQIKLIFYFAIGFILLLSFLTLFIAWRLRGA
ncbi:hypothetical protein [Enterococcus saccharolyticus]|uniref:Uncharacterized protein n=1 Tax=Enterococcus saccharolyticus subsp. saccharolyticus ATCC 43076 TaxID=1139996 RepID=S0JRA9_9ENTE|nr:hypothetical protein [Enterococcus saccharolyticus]EOT30453.1 hypothetical protein OMQ_00156 [Enterococcus saccharolyticus subsp. saccharolyticus ATCC 43076]EOT80014.1 hypothetical protein I572_00538 [Enterococcus saccharolyticus subsp. saccharolyticus ATCC 43076]